jgi:hypothetical protein
VSLRSAVPAAEKEITPPPRLVAILVSQHSSICVRSCCSHGSALIGVDTLLSACPVLPHDAGASSLSGCPALSLDVQGCLWC